MGKFPVTFAAIANPYSSKCVRRETGSSLGVRFGTFPNEADISAMSLITRLFSSSKRHLRLYSNFQWTSEGQQTRMNLPLNIVGMKTNGWGRGTTRLDCSATEKKTAVVDIARCPEEESEER